MIEALEPRTMFSVYSDFESVMVTQMFLQYQVGVVIAEQGDIAGVGAMNNVVDMTLRYVANVTRHTLPIPGVP